MRRLTIFMSVLVGLAINLGSSGAGAQLSGLRPQVAPDPIQSRAKPLSKILWPSRSVLDRSPRRERCTRRKIAVLTVDWGRNDHYIGQANNFEEALRSRGWDTRMIGTPESQRGVEPVSMPETMKEAVEESLSDVARCDQVLISLHAHGNEQSKKFAFTTVTGLTKNETEKYKNALKFEFVTESEPFPFDDQSYFEGHAAGADLSADIGSSLSAGELVEIVRSLRAQGVEVSVLDASCRGGNTVQALSVLEDPGVCSVSLAPVFGPAGNGFRFAGYVDDATTMTEFADGLSNHYYARHSSMLNGYAHESLYFGLRDTRNDGRLQSIGYRSGCTDLMPARDVLYLAWDTIVGTFPNTARQRPSHVVRRPERYSVPGDEGLALDPDLDPFLRETYIENPYWAKDAFARWIDEVAEKLFLESTLDHAGYAAARGFHTAIVEYRQVLADLDCALNDQWWECEAAPSAAPEADEGVTSSADDYPLGEVMRRSLSGSCICEDEPEQAEAWGIDCEEARFVAGLPGAMPVTSCSDPEADVDAFIQTHPEAHARLLDFQVALDDVVNAAVEFEVQLQRLEQACGSPACDAQEL